MPSYDYRCSTCGYEFTEEHPMNALAPECPECESQDVKRVIKRAPNIAQGMRAHAGDGKKATKEQLQAKWAEESPKLRKQLRDKLGEDAVKDVPSLNHNYEED
jgi:putative FmdB family regulatory protein